MMVRSWYGRATLITRSGLKSRIRATICVGLVGIHGAPSGWAAAAGRAISSHLALVRLARQISREHLGVLRALVHDHAPDPAGPDDQVCVSWFSYLRPGRSGFVIGVAAQPRRIGLQNFAPLLGRDPLRRTAFSASSRNRSTISLGSYST